MSFYPEKMIQSAVKRGMKSAKTYRRNTYSDKEFIAIIYKELLESV